MQIVSKKILPEYFKDVLWERKTFELRKDEDNVQVDDMIELAEWENGKYTGRVARCKILYVLRNCPEYGLMEGYCIIGIGLVGCAIRKLDPEEPIDQ